MRIFEHPRSAVAHIQVAGDGEEPRTNLRVCTQADGVADETEPRFLEQVFSGHPASCQASEEREESGIVLRVHGIERIGVSGAKAAHQFEFDVSVQSDL